jgi:hypothetical protein
MSETSTPPELGEVFISYSWDNEEHIKAVLSLSDRLRSDGIDCVLDQYEVSPAEGWPRWTDRKIADASLVLVVCTETYLNRVMGREVPDKGHGVKWEGNIIYQHLYNQGAENQKFIPVLIKDADRNFIPTPLQGASFSSLEGYNGYDRLYGRLLGKPQAEKPPLGQRRAKPKKEVKTDFVTYIESPIDVALWDKAEWRATAFVGWEGAPPALGIVFLNKEPAEEIFRQWQHRYGKHDEFEELRIAIIEGDIAGEDPGYTVHIGVDFDNVLKRYEKAGLSVEYGNAFATVTRMNRMTPEASSPYLAWFKKSFKQHGEYLLVPATCRPDGSNMEVAPQFGIGKRVVRFRDAKDVREGELDSVVLHAGKWDRPLTEYGRSRKQPKKQG